MSCENCKRAEARAEWPIYTDKCRGCQVRSLAHGQLYFRSKEAGRLTAEYKRVLTLVFGDDWEKGHEEVKRFAEKIRQAREVIL